MVRLPREKHTHPDPAILCLGVSPRKKQEKVYSSFTHNHQKLETNQMFFNWRMVKQTTVHPYNGIPFTHQKE